MAAVAAATGVAALMFGRFQLSDLILVYLLATVFVAARFGRGPSALAAVLGVAVLNYLFVPPRFTFAVAEAHHVVTFGVMLVVGLVVGTLTHRAREQAEAAHQAAMQARAETLRSTLLSSLSHDLRTPLAAIMGSASALLVEEERLDPEQRRELARTVYEEGERLTTLVNDILSVTRLESGGVQVHKEWVPIEELVGAALARLGDTVNGRAIDVRLPADLPLAQADPVLLEQLLFNLLDNAVRHTPAGTPIEVVAESESSALRVEVCDRGPGLPPDAERRLFEKFYRGPGAPSGGTGLGLTICRGIVMAHGGSIEATDRPGGGSIFRFRLPFDGEPPTVPAETAEEGPE